MIIDYLGIGIILIVLLIIYLEINITVHQNVVYLCYKSYEKNQIEFGFKKIIKCVKIWEFKK